jgi:hypothetical protein
MHQSAGFYVLIFFNFLTSHSRSVPHSALTIMTMNHFQQQLKCSIENVKSLTEVHNFKSTQKYILVTCFPIHLITSYYVMYIVEYSNVMLN